MRKLSKKVIGMALALAMASTTIAPVTVKAEVTYNKSQTLYKTSVDGGYGDINIFCTKASEIIKKSTIKTSNEKVIQLYALRYYASKNKIEYLDKSMKDSNYQNYNYTINFRLNKTGKSTIAFKIGDKTYKTNVTVKDYVNPISSITISGINAGKNFASKFKTSSNTEMALNKDITNPVVNVKAKSGWKIRSLNVSDSTRGIDHSVYSYGKEGGISNAVVQLDKIKSNNDTYIHVELVDGKGGVISCECRLQ